jgi:type I restriction enzyme S subunit
MSGLIKMKIGDFLRQSLDAHPVMPGEKYPNVGIYSFGRGVFEKLAIDGSASSAKALYRIRSGQFIYSRLFAFEGAYSIVPDFADGYFVSNEFPVFDIDEKKASAKFLRHFFGHRPVWEALRQLASGMGDRRRRIKPERLLDHAVWLPPVAEQNRIVAKVESLVVKIDEAKRLREAIETDAQAMLRSAFQQVIEGAEYRPMSEVAPIVRRPVEIELEGEYPELGVRSFGKGVFHKPTLVGADLDWQKLYRVHSDDLVISNIKAWEGAIAVAGEKDHNRVGSHRYITCVPEDGVATAGFLCFYLLSSEGIEQVRAASPGSADRNRTLAMKRLEKIEVPVPAYEKQLQFNRLQAQATVIQQAQAENQTELDALLPAILDRAFKGEL